MTSDRKRSGKDRGAQLPSKEKPVNSRRRRLVKGAAAAAPGIFTLYSGSAQALASSYQCIARDRAAFTGENVHAGEGGSSGKYVRLAKALPENVIEVKKGQDVRWLVKIKDSTGDHFLEASSFEDGFDAALGIDASQNEGLFTEGATWNQCLSSDNEWTLLSGTGTQTDKYKFQAPDGSEYNQKFTEEKEIHMLACVDDQGNVVSASPQECDAQGLAPATGSCWASIGSNTNTEAW